VAPMPVSTRVIILNKFTAACADVIFLDQFAKLHRLDFLAEGLAARCLWGRPTAGALAPIRRS
jgi:hypothetical protein